MTPKSIDDAADWVTVLLQEGGGGIAPFRTCMELGSDVAEVRVFDDAGQEYKYGDPLYEDAYLIALRRIMTAGRAEPVCENDGEHAAWAAWMAGDPLAETRAGMLDIGLRYVRGPEDEQESGPLEDTRSSHQRATDYLMAILKVEGSVRYSRFYDGSRETSERMAKEFDADDNYPPELVMDDVVWKLKQKGVVRKTDLAEKLADDENDYLIELIGAKGD